MDSTHIPYFAFTSNGAKVTRRLLEFRKLCSLFVDETMDGRDPSVKIMKRIIDFPPFRGIPVLNNLFELLKDSVFSYQEAKVKGIDVSANNVNVKLLSTSAIENESLTPPLFFRTRKSNDTFLHWKTYRVSRKLQDDLLKACRDHENAVHLLREAVENYREINEKCIKTHEKLRESAEELYASAFTDGQIDVEAASLNIHQKCVHFSNKYKLYKEKVEQAYDKLKPLYEKEKNIREERINKTEDKLSSLIVSELRETIMEGTKNLLKVAKSARFSEKFVERLESLDCHEVAAKLYKDWSGKYFHPVINESYPDMPIAMTSFVDQYFDVMEKVEVRFRAHGTHVCLLEEGIHEKRRENLYVWANDKLQDKTQTTQLRFKTGTKIKQKLCSADGKLAFGWKRTFAGGTKKYGFFPTGVTRLVP